MDLEQANKRFFEIVKATHPLNKNLDEDVANVGGRLSFSCADVRISVIQAHEARNYYGDQSGWTAGTPDGDRYCVELRASRQARDGENPAWQHFSYKNFWG